MATLWQVIDGGTVRKDLRPTATQHGVQPTRPLPKLSIRFDGCRSSWWRAADARSLGGNPAWYTNLGGILDTRKEKFNRSHRWSIT